MSNIRNVSIGTRLALGFAGILVAMCLLLAGISINNSNSRESLLAAIDRTNAQKNSALEMRDALLSGAVAIRNIGLQTTLDAVQREEAQAKKERKRFLDAKSKLENSGLGNEEKAVFARLVDADQKMSEHLSAAIGLASMFNTEQAAAIITTKIDPLLEISRKELDQFILLQEKQVLASIEEANRRRLFTELLSMGIAALVVLGAVLVAWRLTVSITQPLRVAVETAQWVADGDLASVVEVSGQDEPGKLLAALQNMQQSLKQVVGNVRHGAESMATASAEIAQGNNDLSARTENQASALEETAASMEELSSTVKQNADNAKQANQLAQSASTVAIKGGEVVAQVVQTMKGINDASKKISDIISVIDGIAFQTNILALNAAVEAARAGEQGRGFAVVASEVRSLAGRSADAAKEIKTLISNSVERVEQGTALVDQAGATMTEVVSSIRRVTDIMGEISAASTEQSLGVAQVGEAVTQMDQATQQNAALVEEMAAAASSLKSQAHELVQTVAVFKLSQGNGGATSHGSAMAPRSVQAHSAPAPVARKLGSTPVKPASKPSSLSAPATAPKAGGHDWENF